jgi:hypothetical protein
MRKEGVCLFLVIFCVLMLAVQQVGRLAARVRLRREQLHFLLRRYAGLDTGVLREMKGKFLAELERGPEGREGREGREVFELRLEAIQLVLRERGGW